MYSGQSRSPVRYPLRRRSSIDYDDSYRYPGDRNPRSPYSRPRHRRSNFDAKPDRTRDKPYLDKFYPAHVAHINAGAVIVNPQNIPKVKLSVDPNRRPEWNRRFDSAPPVEKGPPNLALEERLWILIKGNKLVSGSNVGLGYVVLKDVADLTGEEIEIPGIPLPFPLAMPFAPDIRYKDWSVWSVEVAAFWAKRVICDVASNSADGDDLVSVYHVRPGSCSKIYADIDVVEFMRSNHLLFSKPVIMGHFSDMR
ncbi:OLC1v1003941C1 [Oldenlandia corymbosa var. corymbosa]|uniref:OLC1v1003941C1 n=1 Tax=Oldenlandia corymbosa var. corymbosa TaxID=529605 RepID=A0AAV1DDJ2_OLDCO|nr:OLC1v1003941C1 [Oldenlandia corymbosa var. corymbosa]